MRWLASLLDRMCVHAGDGQTYLVREQYALDRRIMAQLIAGEPEDNQ